MSGNDEPGDSHKREKKVDEAIKHTFPASDPVRVGKPTSTEKPARPVDRKAAIPTIEQIDAARRGDGHKQN